jgi:hypothetical protein
MALPFLFTPEASCAITSFLADQLVVVVFLFLSFLHGHGVGEPREFPYLHAFTGVRGRSCILDSGLSMSWSICKSLCQIGIVSEFAIP